MGLPHLDCIACHSNAATPSSHLQAARSKSRASFVDAMVLLEAEAWISRNGYPIDVTHPKACTQHLRFVL